MVILDLGLGDMDGVDLCRRVREWSDVPIIVLSAEDSEAPEDRRARRGRRRLRHQAVLDAGAARTRPRGAAPATRPPTSRTIPSSSAACCVSTSPTTTPPSRRRDLDLTPKEFGMLAALTRTRAACSRTARCCTRCGARATTPRATTCGSTRARSARSSGPRARRCSSPSRASATGCRSRPGVNPAAAPAGRGPGLRSRRGRAGPRPGAGGRCAAAQAARRRAACAA